MATHFSRPTKTAVLLLAAGASSLFAQVSTTAYRVLGQINFRLNGTNMVQGVELNSPAGIALDVRGGQTHVYISDTGNARVLAWADAASYQIGDAPTLVLGQPGPQYSNALGIGPKGFSTPVGLAVDPATGNLYVTDRTNSRVLRFPSPFANPNRIEPDAVYGQPNFTNRTAGSISASSLNQPLTVAFDPAGNLWVADTGNHRVVRFNGASLNSAIPSADVVIGQKDFFSNGANGGGQVSGSVLNTPSGLVFDSQGNLYVSDPGNTRVLKFAAPLATNATATAVFGESNFATRGTPAQATASSMLGPQGLSLDANNLYVSVPLENRVLIFPLTITLGGPAKNVLGQSDFSTTTANSGSAPQASPNSLFTPTDVKVDQNGNIFVADAANNRVLAFAQNSKSANRVWGQNDFVANGVNQIKPSSINFPYKMAIDYSSAPYALYVSDAANNRVLIWKDSARFRNGDPADLVIGQPNLRTAIANVDTNGTPTPSRTSLSRPEGIAVNSNDGTLWVADSGNNRVLRFARPVNQGGRITPEAVLGQADFTSAASAAVGAATLNTPAGVAIGPNGNVFVSDSGNNRVLEFPAGAGNGSSAVRVYGQPSMTTGQRPTQLSPQTLASPIGIAVDQASNLYVADAGANRVLIFPNTQSAPPAGAAATFVLGQTSFGVAATAAGNFKTPSDVAVDSNGDIYVADNGNNRVVGFAPLVFLSVTGASAQLVIGQPDGGSVGPNWDSTDGLATQDGLYAPTGLYIDRQDTLYVGDAGNNRLLHFLKPAVAVNAATFLLSSPVGQGALASLFSLNLTTDSSTVSATTWPKALLNRQLVINDDLPAPLYFVGPKQVNFQMPTNAPAGADRIAVRTADTSELIAGGQVLVSQVSPGLFTANQQGSGQAAVLNQDGTVNSATNPAPQGSTISLYGTGQGQVSPAVSDGTAAPGLPSLAVTVAVPTSDQKTCLNNQPSMCVIFGSALGNVSYSGLGPGYIGLWQINVQVPTGLQAGAVGVRVIINGSPGNIVTVAVR